ncbi:Imm72 family immunity protein [Caballeronia sp. GAFFF1]|uniref:Imm72 family immunity protein n=1 Tax=Caballeronia sp. GAFFF1 TaxID=2921779 RepID=UPI002028E0D8|nr:Imm72 family immunity protein [Caballeronia sp. GAFFF1]
MSAFTFVAGKNDDDARARAFYLLQKYTSATLLQRAIDLYREFLRDFEREVKRPENAKDSMQSSYQQDLVFFLQYLQPMEFAEPLLANASRRTEAFALMREARRFDPFIWGRRYQESGASEPGSIFHDLGYRYTSHESIGTFAKAATSSSLIFVCMATLFKRARVYFSQPLHSAHSAMCWTYDSVFFDELPINYVPPIVFPSRIPSCPPRNESNEGQIWSEDTIPVTGIWEPWPVNAKTGPRCPNYYIAGDTANQYQMEGTDTLERVRWRLIWKDTRYADGTIPYEERDYFAPPPPVVRNRRLLTARPGDSCPRSGEWFSHHLNRRVNVKAGEQMPGPERSKTGAVIWYLELDD